MSANLILHWRLDLVNDGNRNLVADATANRLHGTLEGKPTVVPDAKFGSCLEFDGSSDRIALPDSDALQLHHFTAAVWIKTQQADENWHGILGKLDGSIPWDAWHHVAITNDGQTSRTYIDGNPVVEGPVGESPVVDTLKFIVGRNVDGDETQYYKGCMAHVRLYDGALSVAGIRRAMQHDEAAASAFVRSHPIGFELYNEDNQHVLYIDDHPMGQTMSLDIINTSTQPIEGKDLGDTASPQKHHFELRFRPETLRLPQSADAAANLPQPDVATEGWSLKRLHRPGQVGGTSLYLLRQGAFTLKPGERITLQLTGMNADGRGGTHGTRVELVTQNMHFSGDPALLQDTRLQHLNIVNHRGRRNIPLHVGFVGTDTVLSDGCTSNTLRLRIANLSRDVDLPLTQESRFRVSFDVQEAGETREWALVDHSSVISVSLKMERYGKADLAQPEPDSDNNLGQTAAWTIAPRNDTALEADGSIILELSGLVALESIGHANIYINFENIPGYQDQQMTLAVQKSPLLYANHGVGIGTKPIADNRLTVQGDAKINGTLTASNVEIIGNLSLNLGSANVQLDAKLYVLEFLIHSIANHLDLDLDDLRIIAQREHNKRRAEEKIEDAESRKQPNQVVVPYAIGEKFHPYLRRDDLRFLHIEERNFQSYYPLTSTEKKDFGKYQYAVVVKQSPEAGSIVAPGTVVQLWYIAD